MTNNIDLFPCVMNNRLVPEAHPPVHHYYISLVNKLSDYALEISYLCRDGLPCKAGHLAVVSAAQEPRNDTEHAQMSHSAKQGLIHTIVHVE